MPFFWFIFAQQLLCLIGIWLGSSTAEGNRSWLESMGSYDPEPGLQEGDWDWAEWEGQENPAPAQKVSHFSTSKLPYALDVFYEP